MASKIKVTLIRSGINRPETQKRTVAALGLGKVSGFVLVSRLEHPGVTFAPYRLERSEQRGRMAMQYWVR